MSIGLDPADFDHAAATPTERLFMNIILVALYDAAGRAQSAGGLSRTKQAQESALAWFQEGGEDFRAVCLFAGFHYERVQTGALAYIAKVTADPRQWIRSRKGSGHVQRQRSTAITLQDVAIHAKVCRATVTRVLADDPTVKPATRNRVSLSVAELAYVAPNKATSHAH